MSTFASHCIKMPALTRKVIWKGMDKVYSICCSHAQFTLLENSIYSCTLFPFICWFWNHLVQAMLSYHSNVKRDVSAWHKCVNTKTSDAYLTCLTTFNLILVKRLYNSRIITVQSTALLLNDFKRQEREDRHSLNATSPGDSELFTSAVSNSFLESDL